MLDATGVLRKIKKLLGVKTDLQLSEILHVKPNTISSWKKRNSLQYENLIELCKEHRINLNDIFFEELKEEYSSEIEKRRAKLISQQDTVAYFLNPEATLSVASSFVFPTVEEIDIAFQIATNNMHPSIKITSFVLTKKTTISDLKPWHVYLFVVKDKGLFVYRYKRTVDAVKLELISDNPKYPNVEIFITEIRELFAVKGVFLPDFKAIGDI